jgi:hypothetical protein
MCPFFPHILHIHNILLLYHENGCFYKGHSEIHDMRGAYKRVYLHNYIVSIYYQSLQVYHKIHVQLLTSYISAAPQKFHIFHFVGNLYLITKSLTNLTFASYKKKLLGIWPTEYISSIL